MVIFGAKSYRIYLFEGMNGVGQLKVGCLEYDYSRYAACLNIPPLVESSVAPRKNPSYLTAPAKLGRLPPGCAGPMREADLSML